MAKDNEDAALDLADLIRDLGHGATNRQGSAKLAELLNACRTTGKKGSMDMKLAISAGQDGIAEIRASIKSTKPEAVLPGSAYYVTAEGGLVTEDPRQLKLPVTKLGPQAVVPMHSNNGGKAS